MGNVCAGSKQQSEGAGGADDLDAQLDQGGTADGGKQKTFRERRLSMSQMPDPNARRRRLSVYGGGVEGDEQVPSVVVAPMVSCGCKTVGGVEPVPGGSTAKINQDRGVALYPFKGDPKVGLFGVYDGHGRVGEQVSEYVLQNLPGVLADHPTLETDAGGALTDAYLSVDGSLSQHVDAGVSGTTAVTCLIKDKHLWLANAGDSRAIIARRTPGSTALKAIDLTVDQKPDSPGEMKRILQMGGHVTPAGANGSPSRVWHNLRGLAMARSIGDHHAATVGVIADPEITEYDLVDEDMALIIASDGVWELLSSQTVVDIISHCKRDDPSDMCDKIVDQSTYMWKIEEGDYRDDITVIVLLFPWLPKEGVAAEAPAN